MPMRVWLSQSHRNSPTTIARPSMKSRLVAYRSPAISKKWVTAPGHTTRSREASEVSEHLVGDDHRHRDRDQRLAQILPWFQRKSS